MDLGEWIEKEGMTINEFCRKVDIIPFNMYEVIRDETKKKKSRAALRVQDLPLYKRGSGA